MDKTRIERLYELYCELFARCVAESDHLKLPSFHNFLSCFVNARFCHGDAEIPPMVHLMMLQESGSGKGRVQRFIATLLEDLGKDAKIVNEFTTAGVIGTIHQPTGDEDEPRPLEHLRELQFLGIDEMTVFTCKPNSHAANFIPVINGYMDTGRVRKQMADGALDYSATCTLSFGSFVDNSVQRTVLHTGFVQRCWLTYKEFTDEESRVLRRSMDRLAELPKDDGTRLRFIGGLKTLIGEFATADSTMLTLTKGIGQYLTDQFENLERSIKIDDLSDDLRTVFRSSLSRSKQLVYKLILHYVYVNGDSDATSLAVDYAIKGVGQHLQSFVSLLRFMEQCALPAGVRASTRLAVREGTKKKLIEHGKAIGTFTRKELHTSLKHQWGVDVGSNLIDELLQELIGKGVFTVSKGQNNETKLKYVT